MEGRISRTLDYWQTWAEKCRYHGPHQGAVLRSALTLKLLTFAPTGGIVAAATTSLPEAIGGVRNWDYRFAWLRDSALILYSLMELGYQEEAHAFMKMMMKTCVKSCAENRPLQIMYRIDGESELPEQCLSHLEGYRKSQPVRVGNAAAKQLQLDTFGELLNCVYTHHWRDHTPPSEEDLEDLLCLISHVTDFVLVRWKEPDHGIWEFRDQPRHFVYSKEMSWVALDRAIKLVEERKLHLDTGKWKEAREEDQTYRFRERI
ncbi:MAG: glycoside hydrolase family 15 protein (plasmid) [Candidatus Manganitrophus sp.]|nr:MAG: glycoside hydrolase family 15 protein [Candidatus Manganitrophus sp.]